MQTLSLVRWTQALKKEEWLLLGGSAVLVVALIVLGIVGVLPFGEVDFAFFSVIVFLAALFRPAWMFLILIALLPLETTTLAPASLGFGLHPYQWWSVLLFLAIIVRVIGKRMVFPPFRLSRFDLFLGLLLLGALMSALVSAAPGAVRLSIILASYYPLYILGRIFFCRMEDVFVALPFFLSSTLIVSIFSIIQNLFFMAGHESFSVMPGRPNGTLSEADWLGLFLLIGMTILLAVLWKGRKEATASLDQPFDLVKLVFPVLLTLFMVVLILTVSRSAWLAGGAMLFIFVTLSMMEKRESLTRVNWKDGLFFSNFLVVVLALSLFIVNDLGLTRFELFNRAQSTGSGLQKITLACTTPSKLPEKINTLDELSPLGCEFIPLESIESKKTEGKFIQSIYRPDPNISIRRSIYATVFGELQAHPFFGVGWGSIGDTLGRDERGAALNASNVYLEIWLGAGLIGILSYLLWLCSALLFSFRTYLYEESLAKRGVALFFFLSLASLSLFDLFNSGILLGFVWILFSLAPLFDRDKALYEENRH